jgi:hypothetical protein
MKLRLVTGHEIHRLNAPGLETSPEASDSRPDRGSA